MLSPGPKEIVSVKRVRPQRAQHETPGCGGERGACLPIDTVPHLGASAYIRTCLTLQRPLQALHDIFTPGADQAFYGRVCAAGGHGARD